MNVYHSDENTITRTEISRSEYRFTARRGAHIIANTWSYDTALTAFNRSERPAVKLLVEESK